MENDTAVAVLIEQVTSLRARLDALEKDVQAKFDRIESKLDQAIAGRPTWAIVFFLTGLSTLCTGLTVYILTRGV